MPMQCRGFQISWLILGLIAATPAMADSLFDRCAAAMVKLQAAGIVEGLKVHGTNPMGFELLVNQTKWQMIATATQTKIVHIAACDAAQGDGTLQINGIVHDAQTNKQLGAMNFSGEYFPMATGPGVFP